MNAAAIFLIGGGWSAEAYPLTYGPFVEASSQQARTRIACVLLDDPQRDDFFGMVQFAFNAAGTQDIYPVFVSAERPLRKEDLDDATGLFVAGGLTPGYHAAIVPTAGSVIREKVKNGVPYAGNSAGAMIAPDRSLIGGWLMPRNGRTLQICSQEVSEELDELDIRDGLELVPFAVDPHAAQYGTPTRLLHAVDAGHISEGWAVDEDTVLIYRAGQVSVAGTGVAWNIRKRNGQLTVDILQSE